MTPPERDNLLNDLSAYLDGELSATAAQRVESLLDESAEARQMLRELRRVSEELAALPRRPAPRVLAAEVMQQAERDRLIRDEAQPPGRWQMLKLLGQLGAAAAVLVACVLVGHEVLRSDGTGAPPESVGDAAGVHRDLRPATVLDEEAVARPMAEPRHNVPASGEALADNTRAGGLIVADAPLAGYAMASPGTAGDDLRPSDRTYEFDDGNVEGAGPVVRVVVEPRDGSDFAAAERVLLGWGTPADEPYAVPAPGQAIARVFAIDPAQLNPYIDALAATSGDRVRVQMDFVGRERALLARAYGVLTDADWHGKLAAAPREATPDDERTSRGMHARRLAPRSDGSASGVKLPDKYVPRAPEPPPPPAPIRALEERVSPGKPETRPSFATSFAALLFGCGELVGLPPAEELLAASEVAPVPALQLHVIVLPPPAQAATQPGE